MQSLKVRILVVEDFAPFQRVIQSTLEENPELQIVGVASDGAEGVRQAEKVQPDLVLLDIGLPKLNGIEVAKRILKSTPQCKILFVTQESSGVLVREAFRAGAHGYVLKGRIFVELLSAVKVVLEGNQFVSTGLSIDY